MRIAVPVSNDRTAETLSGIEGFQFFVDDLGRIVRRFFVPRGGEGAAAAVAQLEPYGVDALVCGALPGDERLETAAAGILLFPTFSGTPEEAALAFLGGAVARDPNNKCNACGFQSSCSLSGKGGCGKTRRKKAFRIAERFFPILFRCGSGCRRSPRPAAWWKDNPS